MAPILSRHGVAGYDNHAKDTRMTTATTSRRAFRFHPLLWGAAAVLLLIPAAAMLLTAEVNWGAEDFAAMSLMLTVLCLCIEAAWHWLADLSWRLIAVMLSVLIFLTVWAHLAVNLLD
jgi:hypothetical protein